MPFERLKPVSSLDKDRLNQLKQLIPEAFADGKINWDTLREVLDEHLEDVGEDAEHFGLTWPGKKQARRLATIPSKGTLVPVPGEGVNEGTTENIFIEGDNLEVLKLLQKSYAGRIKMVYIDPPYNTGNDFIYKDNFEEPLQDYLKKTKQIDEEGNLLTTNTKSEGRFHSNWLNMMYPRLRLARNLLAENGTIFVNIDDNEVYNLRQIMNEVFGEENFIATLVWQKMDSPSRNDPERFITEYHDYIIIFAKSKDKVGLLKKSAESILDGYNISLPDGRKVRRRQLRKNGKGARREDRPTLFYPLIAPDGSKVFPVAPEGWEGRWVLSGETWQERTQLGLTEWIKRESGWVPYYLEVAPEDPAVPWPTLWTEVDQNRQAVAKFTALMGSQTNFLNPKPVDLIQDILRMATTSNNSDIVLDFFAGSGTTGHAVYEINKMDGGNRQFLLVQLPEKTNNRDYLTIAEITKERLRRAIRSSNESDDGRLDFEEVEVDLGFKTFKLQRSNFKAWQNYNGEGTKQLQDLFSEFESTLNSGWQEKDLLVEVMLLEGFPLSSAISTLKAEFTRNKVYQISSNFCSHKLYICLENEIWEGTINQVPELLLPEDIFICLDNALTDENKTELSNRCNLKTI